MDLVNNKNENILLKIRKIFPTFDEEELLEYTKAIIPNVSYFLNYENKMKLKRYCSDEFISKALENKDIYRISKDIDSARVEYARLKEIIEKEDKLYIKVYASVFFYDDVDNNTNSIDGYDKYWNDIWIITYEANSTDNISSKCPNCGAQMDYNVSNHMFTCNYCRNSLYYSKINWKIIDITVNEINYK